MPIQEDLQAFLAEWHDPSPFLEVQTSGSTGTAQADESAQGPDAEQRPAYLRLSGS